jgi:hypothetical protein
MSPTQPTPADGQTMESVTRAARVRRPQIVTADASQRRSVLTWRLTVTSCYINDDVTNHRWLRT